MVDSLLAEIAHELRADGLRLAGAVQSNPPRAGRSRCDMVLEDLGSGRRIAASEDRGPLARGCRLDIAALEEAAACAQSALDRPTDLLIVNRFGKREAEGRGFRSVIELAVMKGVPVLVGLNHAHRESWNNFVDHQSAILAPTNEAVMGWVGSARVCGQSLSYGTLGAQA